MALNGSTKVNFDKNTCSIIFSWQVIGQTPSSSQTVISWNMKYQGNSTTVDKERKWSATIDGNTYSGTVIMSKNTTNQTLASGSVIIYHDINGNNYSFDYSFSQDINAIGAWIPYIGTVSGSGTGVINGMDREAHLLSAQDFTDEDSPTITYSAIAGSDYTELLAGISFSEGSYVEIPYRALDYNKTSYTFDFTENELTIIRNKINTGAPVIARFYIKSKLGEVTNIEYKEKTLSFVGYLPTMNPTVKDINARTVELTGDNKTFIKGFSNAQFALNASVKKGAYFVEQYAQNGQDVVSNNTVTNTSLSGVINGITSNTFYFGVTDSRGAELRDFKTLDIVPYIPLTVHLESSLMTPDGSVSMKVSGKYYNGSFGAKNNTMEIEYAVYDRVDITWHKLGTISPIVDNNDNYEYEFTITGLNYEQSYEIQVNVIDELSPILHKTVVIAATPIFDWNANDFHHHTDIVLSNAKYIHGTDTQGRKNLGLILNDESNSCKLGYGNYYRNIGNTEIYGKSLNLYSKDGIKIDGNALADYVIEQASTGVWFYRKWNSGRCELYGYQNISNKACNTALGGMYRTAAMASPAFPFSVNNPKVTASYESDGYGALIWFTTNSSSTKPGDYYLIRPTSSAAITGKITFHIDGTWK